MGKLIIGENDLATLYPEHAKQWCQEKNGIVFPNNIAAYSNKTFWWRCNNGHIYDASVDKKVAGEGCPYCSNKRVLPGYNDLKSKYPDIAKEWDYENNIGDPDNYVFGSTYTAHWICTGCGNRWQTRILSRTKRETGCPECARKRRGNIRHQKALEQAGPIANPLLLSEWDYKNNAKSPSDYTEGNGESVYWICSKCGHSYRARIANRTILGRGCPCCSNKVVESGKNDLSTTHPQLAKEWHPTLNGDLKPTQVTYGSGKKVWWLCPENHEYQATVLHRSSGTSCSVCNSGRQTSFAEQATFYYVKKIFPDAINRYTASFLGKLELDIFIPSIKLAIEYDGEAWHKADKISREKKKYQICQEHGIKLLRLREKPLDSDRYIQDYGLSIEGNMYEHKQLANVIRMLIDKLDPESNFWTRKKPDRMHSAIDINLDRDELEIRQYMTSVNGLSLLDKYPELVEEWHPTMNKALTPDKVKPGSDIKVWWSCPNCGDSYFSAISKRVSGTGCPKCGAKKAIVKRCKPVQMIDIETNEVINTFASLSEASRQMKISSGNIFTVCKGNGRRQAGGYFWRYI